MRRKLRLLAVLAVMAVLATGAYAFTAPNIVPDSSAGFGAGDIDGYTVSGITYGLDGGGDTDQFGNAIETVDFTLTEIAGNGDAPTEVTVWFDNSTSTPDELYSVESGDCSISGGGPWQVHCNVTEFAADIERLRIGAAQ